ncbi:unnamed protein product, partial [Polarella glacialis]
LNISAPGAGDADVKDSLGYLKIITFNGPEVLGPVKSALRDFPEIGGLVVDLRDNRGGRLREARLASLEIAKALEALQPRQQQNPQAATLGLLVTSNTASASELMVTQLRGQGLQSSALVISCGEDPPSTRTYGKSEEQEAIDLSDGGALLLTTSRWGPEGFKGVPADVLCSPFGVPRWAGTALAPRGFRRLDIASARGKFSTEEEDGCVQCAAEAMLAMR